MAANPAACNGFAGNRRKAARTTFRDVQDRPVCGLVDRNFYAEEPKQLWVADIIYVPTWPGFVYLAVVLDAFSRRIPGDNAMCESFFATLKCVLPDRQKFQTKVEARMAIFQFIEGWYNPGKRHFALGYQSPINCERYARERLESANA